jgi:tripartite-type tricarboxylate transporter receptor subunit TctC
LFEKRSYGRRKQRGTTMKLLPLAVALSAIWGSCAGATAQVAPSRPITLVVPFPAGGSSDTIGRILAEGMRGSLNQSVIIENVSGASGNIGAAEWLAPHLTAPR